MSCITPFLIRHKITGENIPVPCGKCPVCVKRRISGWSFRLRQEDKVSTSSAFITLTYDTKYVPITRNGYMCLNRRDVQLFIKRLRKNQAPDYSPNSIKYYAVGEYGGKSARPHYHLIMFNTDIECIDKAWGLGSVHYGTLTPQSVGYCLKYMSKPGRIPYHKNDDRIPEFSLMSKSWEPTISHPRPSIGIPAISLNVPSLKSRMAKKLQCRGITRKKYIQRTNVKSSPFSVNKKPISSLINSFKNMALSMPSMQTMRRFTAQNSIVNSTKHKLEGTKSKALSAAGCLSNPYAMRR